MFMNFDLRETEDVWTWQHSPVILVLGIRSQEDGLGLWTGILRKTLVL